MCIWVDVVGVYRAPRHAPVDFRSPVTGSEKGVLDELRREGVSGIYFQPWDFDFLARPVHVPGGAILEYVEVTEARLDPSSHVKGTYYAFANEKKGGLDGSIS